MNDAWCEPDDCPAAICNGPHISHVCEDGDVVTTRSDNPDPCPWCGAVAPQAEEGGGA